jgi:hypothetical protein
MKKLILALMTAFTIGSVQAGIVFSESFVYPDGGIVTNSTWLPNTGTANTMLVTNQQLRVSTSLSEDIAHTLNGAPYNTNGSVAALYSSFTLKCIGLPTPGGVYFAHFTGADRNGTLTGHRARIFSSTTNVASGGLADSTHFYLGIGNASGANVTNGQWATALSTNVTYTVVTKYVIGTATATMWINPTIESDPSVTATDFVDPTNYVNIGHYGFRQSSGEGTMLIDDLKVGTAFNDVAGANTSPTISAIGTQNIPANGSTGPLPFTVGDAETDPGSLTVTTSSGNTTLVPNGNVVLGGTGANRTVTVTPVAGLQGVASITVSVSDGANTSPTTFLVQVGAPTIAPIANVQAYSNTPIPAILLTVSDPETDALTFTKTSSNPALVTPADIVFGSSGSSSNVTITPEPNQIGNATITVSVSDGHNTNSSSFIVTISPVLGIVYNENFAYTDFSSGQPNALYGAAGGSGGFWSHVSGPLYELQVTNGLAYIVGTNNEDLGSDFIGFNVYQGSNGVVFYTSFSVNCSFLPTSAGEYFFHLGASGSDSSSFHDKIFANKANAAAGKFRLGVSNVGGEVQYPRDLSVGVTYNVVTRYNSGTGQSELWVNPANEQSPRVVATDSQASSTIGGVALRHSSGTGDLAIGPMRVGTKFSDVFTAPASPALSYVISGSNIILSWSNPLFVLQSATDVNGPYTDLAATSPSTNSISGNQFFRLKY